MPISLSKPSSSWNFSIIHVIHGYAMLWVQLLEDSDHPHEGIFCCNSRKSRTFSVSVPREWNSLPASVRQCTSVAQLKSKLSSHLFSLYYEYECSIRCSRARVGKNHDF